MFSVLLKHEAYCISRNSQLPSTLSAINRLVMEYSEEFFLNNGRIKAGYISYKSQSQTQKST